MQMPRPYYAVFYDYLNDQLRGCIVWCRNEALARSGAIERLRAEEPLHEGNWLFVRANVQIQAEAKIYNYPIFVV